MSGAKTQTAKDKVLFPSKLSTIGPSWKVNYMIFLRMRDMENERDSKQGKKKRYGGYVHSALGFPRRSTL